MMKAGRMDTPLFDEIYLKFISTPEKSIPIKLNKLTVVIGPNNTGKSTLLNEIYAAISNRAYSTENSVVLEKCEPRIIDAKTADELISPFRHDRDYRNQGDGWYFYSLAMSESSASHSHNNIVQSLTNEGSWQRRNREFTNIASLMVKMLDGRSRLSIINDAPLGNLTDPQSMYSLKNAYLAENLDEINAFIYEAFKQYLAVTDVTNAGSAVAYLVAEDLAHVGINPKSHDRGTIDFFSSKDICIEVKSQSDGTKAFLGLLIELIYSSYGILLIDEPEAFLHPTLAYLLGTAVGKYSSNKQIICSTHSVDFLQGCLDSVCELNLLRLTRDRGGSVHIFEDHQLRKMQNVPLLRTASVMNGLFFNAVVVVEGDSDEAFYREINYRLRDNSGYQALNNVLFATSHGVDDEYKIVGILRKAGIPAASIVDFDFLGKPDSVFGSLLSSANIGGVLEQSFKSQKHAVANAVSKANEKKGGTVALNGEEAQAVRNLINGLSDYGIFVVPNGALESWLGYLDVTVSKKDWLKCAFERLGDNPEDPMYVHPIKDDVWAFMEKIAAWVADPNRKGMHPMR